MEWLHSVEKNGIENIDEEEKKSFMLLHDLLFEERAPPNEQLLSIRLVALNYREDALCVWGSMASELAFLMFSYDEFVADMSDGC